MTVPSTPGTERPRGLTAGAVWPFFGLTFALSWGIAALLVAFPDPLTALFGELGYTNPLFILAVYAPGIIGVLLIVRHHGRRGLASFARRLTLWRMPIGWWAFLAVGIPAAFLVGAAVKGNLGDAIPSGSPAELVPALAAALLIGPVEELGWRGVALPLLQRRFTPLVASLVLGAVWGTWHLPAFVLSGTPQDAWSFAPYFAGVVAITLIVTPMFNAARGSLLVVVLFHFQANNPLWPDAHPWDALVFAIVAVVVVAVSWRAMTDRAGAATEVLFPGHEHAPAPDPQQAAPA